MRYYVWIDYDNHAAVGCVCLGNNWIMYEARALSAEDILCNHDNVTLLPFIHIGSHLKLASLKNLPAAIPK